MSIKKYTTVRIEKSLRNFLEAVKRKHSLKDVSSALKFFLKRENKKKIFCWTLGFIIWGVSNGIFMTWSDWT